MISVLATGLIIAALAVAAWSLGLVLLNKTVGTGTLGLLALLELALLAQTVIGIVKLAGADRDVSGAAFVGYHIAVLLILPVAAFLALAERTRWGSAIVLAGCLVVPVMIVRMNQIWNAGA
ncbi:MAG TPA: hypothetical protein VGX25_33510 [Actinophytocola sp.]|uniref:hypothetical protein n=1 Tax=Actinophytocola sp. TaxID=1872138 RepID=UPI002DDDAE89|nr:hypothetical protein [Actinophytocola sp.]HEV2784331.1 hypothetical protein [Actinophytocola sp.]